MALSSAETTRIAHKLVWAAHQMKPRYQTAGRCIVELFCREAGLDPDAIDRAVVDGWDPDAVERADSR